jgi:hypothetical protein
MSYLNPPPGDAPVVVYKDVGGYVDQYDRVTAFYAQTNREVRLHECRSACTLALSLPNVCVYPDSLLKFHKAYDPNTKEANNQVSDALMASYPPAVRQRLGELTRNYKVLTGSELIRLGVRDCNAPRQPNVMIARAKLKPSAPENPVSNAFSGLVAALAPPASPNAPAPVKVASVKVASARTESARTESARTESAKTDSARTESARTESAAPPLPPVAPVPPLAPVAVAPVPPLAPVADPPAPDPVESAAPTPPRRPDDLLAQSFGDSGFKSGATAPSVPVSNWGRRIKGSAPILISARFTPFPYRLAVR